MNGRARRRLATTTWPPSSSSKSPPRMNGRARRRLGTAIASGALVLMATAGCSQVTGLAGGTPNLVFTAQSTTIDLVLKRGERIALGPVCDGPSTKEITCSDGRTASGKAISVNVVDGPAGIISVRLGDERIYDGPVANVLTEEGQVSK